MPPNEIYSYVFIYSADPGKSVRGLVDKLRRDRSSQVIFAVDVAGAYEGFAVTKTTDLAQLQDLIADAELWADAKEVMIEAKGGHRPAKRETCDKLAIVRIRTNHGFANSVFETLDGWVREDERFHGVSMLYGRFDILFTIDAPSFEEVQELSLRLQTVSGIRSTETSFADCTKPG
jgi:hypothetical protein